MKNNYFLRKEEGKIFMCCGKANCPSVELDSDGLVEIKDDYGNSVKMKKEEASLLKDAVLELNKENET